ncbi:hypothetical protein TrLO_g15530 [Triparma laevis f. longispina]|uniref:Amino acid transporter transmembrane domain-containing protein n=1 Tax=Triparma laevis f. longispina TaxID=1714387 RepID=A0A9W7KTN1_9STRA|nr:hypothetical protein TrLO_g15530 [Triparma laevis f. longispina]
MASEEPLMRDQQALAEHEERMNGLNGDGGKGGNKGIFSWFTRRLSKTEVTRRVSFRQKIIGYQPDLDPIFDPKGVPQPSPTNAIRRVVSGDSEPPTPLFSRFRFPEIRTGSIRGSIFNLCSATLGAGALSLPYAFSQAGILMSTALLLIAVGSTLLSIHLLVESANFTGGKSYEEITVMVFGRKMGVLVETSIIVFCFGTCVAYIVAVGDILQQGIIETINYDAWFMNREFFMVVFTAAVMFPLSLFERINSLRYSSLFGICSIFFLVFSASYHSIHGLIADGYDQSWGLGDIIYGVGDFKSVVKACPIIMFAFTCQVNVFSIYEELERSSAKRMSRVSNGAVRLCMFAYLLMGLFGYLDYGAKTQANILQNYCVQKTKDPLMITAFVGIVITIVMAFPLNIFPCRYTLEIIIERFGTGKGEGAADEEQGESTNLIDPASNNDSIDLNTSDEVKNPAEYFRHVLLTFLITALSLLVALVVPNISVVFQLMGGTASAFVCFVLPAAFAIKLGYLEKEEEKYTLWGAWALAVGGVVVGVVSTSVTIYGIFFPEADPEDNCME